MNTPLRGAFAVLTVAALLGGCGGFDKAYEEAAARPQQAGQIEGAWAGTWQSEKSDHKGKLRAIVKRARHDVYNVRYHATYKALGVPMSFEHETTLRGHFAGSTFHFRGAADLGWLPGIYKYTGYATPDEFYSTYEAKDDHGTYTLVRPPTEKDREALDEALNGEAEKELWPGEEGKQPPPAAPAQPEPAPQPAPEAPKEPVPPAEPAEPAPAPEPK